MHIQDQEFEHLQSSINELLQQKKASCGGEGCMELKMSKEQTDKDIAQLKKIVVDGNGQPALKEQMATLTLRVANSEEALKTARGALFAAVGAIALEVLKLAFGK